MTQQRFSLLRALGPADFITLGNAAAGTGCIFLCLHSLDLKQPSLLMWAFALLPVAFACDALDGLVARKSRKQSPYGGDLDSLADTISFGVAPAVLGFTLGMRGVWDALVLVFFVCCGIGRLARFNVTAEALTTETGKVAYFEGTPIPTSLFVVAVLAVAWVLDATGPALWGGQLRLLGMGLHPLVGLFALSGALMVSTVRIPKI